MNKLTLPHDAFVLVGDGRKALFLRNTGDDKFINLKTEQVFVDNNPATPAPACGNREAYRSGKLNTASRLVVPGFSCLLNQDKTYAMKKACRKMVKWHRLLHHEDRHLRVVEEAAGTATEHPFARSAVPIGAEHD